MATLEVHDAQGRVRFIDVDLDHPILFGASPTCDVALEGEGILPVQGRIRWGGRRLKVDASPDAEFLVVNGRRIVTSGLRQGDELTIGSCRIFVLRLDETRPPRAGSKHRRRPDEEATRVLQGAPGRSSASSRSPAPAPTRPSAFESDDLFKALEIEPPADEEVEVEPVETGRSRRGRRRETKTGEAEGRLGRWLKRWRKELQSEAAPGREVVAKSPVVLGLVALLALLVGMGFWLNAIIKKTIASSTYNRAVSLMDDGDYATALRDFDAFLKANPTDKRAGKAKALRALANVRQYITLSGATWSRALETAREMADGVGDLPEFRDEKTELADLVLRIGEGLADRAKRGLDPAALAEAESAVPLHARIAGEPAPAFLARSRLPDLLSEARAAVQKAKTRAETLKTMDAAIGQGVAASVYKARDALLQRYADLRDDAEIRQRMVQANDLMRLAAKVDDSKRSAATVERSEPLGPLTSFVLRSSDEPPAAEAAAVFALADGMAVAIDGGSGAPLWQTAVGLSSPFTPLAVPGDPSVLMVDARHNELVRRDAHSGRLIWRQELGERVDAPPLVLGDQVIQTLPGGKVAFISLTTGELRATIDLGFPITQTPVADESGRFLYVTGARDCLFVLARDPLGCAAVEYLGHGAGSIAAAPVRMGRFLIVAENDRPRDGRWRVMVLDDEGAKPRPVQEIAVAGWTWDAPPSAGSIVWSIGDRGGIEAFAAGDYASAAPLRSLAKLNPDVEASGPSFAVAASEREVWVAAGRAGRFDLDAERGEIIARAALGRLGVAAAPIQPTPKRVVLSFLDDETGGVSLRGVEPATGKIAWETVLGAAWPTPLVADGEALTFVDKTGHRVRADRSQLEAGGFIVSRLPGPGEFRAPDGRLLTTDGETNSTAVIAPPPGADAIWVEDPKAPERWRRVGLPSTLAAPPLPWAGALFVPGEDGRAYLIDPNSGSSAAEPLVPEFDRDHHGRWLAPRRIDADSLFLADDAGKARRIGLKTTPERRLVVEAETTLDQAIVADPAATESALVLATADGRVRSLSARDLGPIGAWPLDAPIVGDPRAAGGRVVVLDASGGVMLIGRDGQRAWSTQLDAAAVGDPLIVGETVWILDRNGKARGLSVGDGREVATIELAAFPAGGLITAGPDVFAPTGRGAVQPLNLAQPPKPSETGE